MNVAAPNIDSLNPLFGPTGGRTLVDVAGVGYRLPPPPPAGGPTTALPPTVEVLVGGRRAEDVRVIAAERLTFLTPAHDAGPADVVVRNLADDGTPIPGEEATLPGEFTYVLPKLTVEADLTRLVRTLLRELKRQVHPNVSLTVQTDFDADTGDELHLTELAALPGLVLVGPELSENRFSSLNAQPETTTEDGEVARRRVPYTVNIGFTVIGVADHTTELINLMAATTQFFHRNKHLEMNRDPNGPAAGVIRYEMDFSPDGDLRITSQPNESNVRSFSGSFVVRGFDLEGLAGVLDDDVVERTNPADEVVIEPPQQLAPTVPVGRNPDP